MKELCFGLWSLHVFKSRTLNPKKAGKWEKTLACLFCFVLALQDICRNLLFPLIDSNCIYSRTTSLPYDYSLAPRRQQQCSTEEGVAVSMLDEPLLKGVPSSKILGVQIGEKTPLPWFAHQVNQCPLTGEDAIFLWVPSSNSLLSVSDPWQTFRADTTSVLQVSSTSNLACGTTEIQGHS